MTKEELKKEAKIYAKRKFNEEEQAYLHDIIAQTYLDGAEPREKRIEELERENAELKTDNDARKFAMAMSEKVEKQLREENEELRNNGFTVSAMTEQQLKVALKKGEQLEKDFRICEKNADTYYDQLTKAIELLAKWVELFKPESETVLPTPIQVDTEQFLKGVE